MRRLVYTSLAVHTCPYLCYYFITKPVEIRVKGTFTNNYAQDTACKGFVWHHTSSLLPGEFNEQTGKTVPIYGRPVRAIEV